ncbi:MAG: hypothetical protein ACRC3H_19130 [Lachnospiraceae bacterium]
MKNTFKKLAAMALAAVMMVAVSVPALAATTSEVNITAYKTGTTEAASMAQPALSTATISYDANNDVTNVEFSVSPIEKYGMLGYLTAFSIGVTEGEDEDETVVYYSLTPVDTDEDNYPESFKGVVDGELELGQVYSALIDMEASGYTHSGYAFDIVFTAVE